MNLVRSLAPMTRIVVGGYDASLAPHAYKQIPEADFIVRGEGEITFRELLRAIESNSGYERIAGLSYRNGEGFCDNENRTVSRLESGVIRPPNRKARLFRDYTMMGRVVDVIETSRGCTFDCSFCSIIEMRGRNFHTYSFDRVLADIQDAYDFGARSIFIVDDNISLNVKRFEALCEAIIDARLNSIEYTVQAMTSSIANHGKRLAPLMHVAQRERQKADRRFTEQRKLANSLITEVQKALHDVPHSVPAQRMLAQKSLEYLNDLGTDAGDDPEFLGDLATAYLNLGYLQSCIPFASYTRARSNKIE